jgi:hypothetical protein
LNTLIWMAIMMLSLNVVEEVDDHQEKETRMAGTEIHLTKIKLTGERASRTNSMRAIQMQQLLSQAMVSHQRVLTHLILVVSNHLVLKVRANHH